MATQHLVTNIAGLLRNCTDAKLGKLFNMNGKKARQELLALQAKGDIYLPSDNCKNFDPVTGCKCAEALKGQYGEECYRTACKNTRALFYNHSTRQHYCPACAKEINQANHTDAIRLYGHELCTLVEK